MVDGGLLVRVKSSQATVFRARAGGVESDGQSATLWRLWLMRGSERGRRVRVSNSDEVRGRLISKSRVKGEKKENAGGLNCG